MKRVGFLIMLAGVAMGIGSCGLVGRSIQRSMDSRLVDSMPIKVGKNSAGNLLTVSSERSCQVSIQADITTPSVKEVTNYDEKQYAAQYRFPVSYQVEDEQGTVLFREDCAMASEGDGPQLVTATEKKVDKTGATLTVEHSFQKFEVPAPGKARLRVQVSPDTEYGAKAKGVTLKLYDNVARHSSSLLSAGAMSCSSPILIFVGLVVFVAGLFRPKKTRRHH